MQPAALTIPERLHGLGYHSGLIGKWHLGLKEEHEAHPGFEQRERALHLAGLEVLLAQLQLELDALLDGELRGSQCLFEVAVVVNEFETDCM